MQSRSQAHNERAFWFLFVCWMPIPLVATKMVLSMRRSVHSAVPTILCKMFMHLSSSFGDVSGSGDS